jgi:hypothetical protein
VLVLVLSEAVLVLDVQPELAQVRFAFGNRGLSSIG